MVNPRDVFTQIDEAQSTLRKIRAVSDLFTCMTDDPPMAGTIQDTGDLLIQLTQECIQILERLSSSCNTILNEEYPDANLSDHK